MLKAVFLDFYGTLVYEDGEKIHKIVSKVCSSGKEPDSSKVIPFWGEQFASECKVSFGENFKTQRAIEYSSLAATVQQFDAEIDIHGCLEELFQYWRTSPLFEETKIFLNICPLPFYIVSNIDRADVLAALSFHGIEPKGVFTSEDAKSYKPRKELFELALQKTGLKPDEVVHIGDSLSSDVQGGGAVGLHTIWLNRRGKEVPEDITSVKNLMEAYDTDLFQKQESIHFFHARREDGVKHDITKE